MKKSIDNVDFNTDQPNPDHEEHLVENPSETSREDNTDQPNPDHEEH